MCINSVFFFCPPPLGKDGSKVTTVVATPGQGPDRPQEVSYTDTRVIGNGSFGVVYQAKLCETNELVAIKKVLQDKRFKVNVYSVCIIINMQQPHERRERLSRSHLRAFESLNYFIMIVLIEFKVNSFKHDYIKLMLHLRRSRITRDSFDELKGTK